MSRLNLFYLFTSVNLIPSPRYINPININTENDFKYICDSIGIEMPPIPKINTSKHKKYREYYNEHTKNLVADCFKKDIELFNYEF